MAFSLPPLPYAYDALVPYMSAETLQFHHDKHHQAYVDMANKLVPGTKYEGKSIEDICKEAYANKDQPIINNVGQDFNHIHFWQWMKKGGGGKKLPRNQERQARDDEDAKRREPVDARRVADPRLRRVGAQLLHRLP
jgi:Fe-Mn family superoxide dismutase